MSGWRYALGAVAFTALWLLSDWTLSVWLPAKVVQPVTLTAKGCLR